MVELLSTESLQVSRGVGLVTTLVFTFQPLNLFKGCFYSRPTSLYAIIFILFTFQPLNLYAIVFILFIIYLHIIVFYIHIV